MPLPVYHAVRFYENDRALARIVAAFLREGLVAGQPAIIVATAVQRAAIIRELSSKSVDVAELQRSADLILLDADDTLSLFMKNGAPDADRFNLCIGEVIARARGSRKDCTVRIFGQMVDVLWKMGMQEPAIRLEVLWNELAQAANFSLLCGYSMGHFYKDAGRDEICRQHTHTIRADGQATAVA